jgi:hypothetical protein
MMTVQLCKMIPVLLLLCMFLHVPTKVSGKETTLNNRVERAAKDLLLENYVGDQKTRRLQDTISYSFQASLGFSLEEIDTSSSSSSSSKSKSAHRKLNSHCNEEPSEDQAKELVRLTENYVRRLLAADYAKSFVDVDLEFDAASIDCNIYVVGFMVTAEFDEIGAPAGGATDVVNAIQASFAGNGGETYKNNFIPLAGIETE